MKHTHRRYPCAFISLMALVIGLPSAISQPVIGTPRPVQQIIRPSSVGINYNILAVKMQKTDPVVTEHFPDAANYSLYVGRGAELVIVRPNGTEVILVDKTLNGLYPGSVTGACTDPTMSYDGNSVFFTYFVDPEDFNTQRKLSRSPAHACKVDVASGTVTQLTTGNDIEWQDTSVNVDPLYAKFDVAPIPLPDGRILFLSNREGVMDTRTRFPAMRFYRMEADGTNIEPIENFTQGSCQHPIVHSSGKIIWTHFHPAARRTMITGNYPLMVANPDMSDWKSFAGVHYTNAAWHFTTELSNGDVATAVYYHQNNWGHGTIVRMPWDSPDPSGQFWAPTSDTTMSYNPYGWMGHAQSQYINGNDHFSRIGEKVVTPWTLGGGSIAYDDASPGNLGKVTMPAGIPGGHMLASFSPKGVNNRLPPYDPPHMKIAYFPNGQTQTKSDMVVIHKKPGWHYMYPRALVPYQQIYGKAAPDIIPDTPNDGQSSTSLPAGTPFAIMGTSSLYNRESSWPSGYDDPWDINTVNNYRYATAFTEVGQDTYAFSNSDIHAAQVVADMSRLDPRYATSTGSQIKTHNNGNQVWGIIGEIPVRKYTTIPGGGRVPILDPLGDPDTSYHVRVPADVPVHNRIIDSNGLTLTQEATWSAPRPGEIKTNCGGCHAHSIDTTFLDFSLTAAAALSATDFGLQTPLVSRNASGTPTIANDTANPRVKVVEWHRDVKPILTQRCQTCHTNTGAPVPDFTAANAWETLAYDDSAFSTSYIKPTWKNHQATRWVRKAAAAQSLLVWKTYGMRLDGRTDATRSTDADYCSTPLCPQPDPHSAIAGLTFDEKRTIAMWVDLGCLVDLSPANIGDLWDPFDDQMRPTLSVQGINWATATAPLPPLRIGVYDLHSGVAQGSLNVSATPVGGGSTITITTPSVSDGDIVTLSLASLSTGTTYRVDISVADNNGNIARRAYTVTP